MKYIACKTEIEIKNKTNFDTFIVVVVVINFKSFMLTFFSNMDHIVRSITSSFNVFERQLIINTESSTSQHINPIGMDAIHSRSKEKKNIFNNRKE